MLAQFCALSLAFHSHNYDGNPTPRQWAQPESEQRDGRL